LAKHRKGHEYNQEQYNQSSHGTFLIQSQRASVNLSRSFDAPIVHLKESTGYY
jgi:hypothetical protein